MESLPDEVLIKILKILPFEDLHNISRVSRRLEKLSYDKAVVRVLDLRQSYWSSDNVQDFFRPATRCRNIEVLTLDCIYWLKSFEFVKKCKNLVALHIMGITLSLHKLALFLKACPKIEHLSYSWQTQIQERCVSAWNLQALSPYLAKLKSLKLMVFYRHIAHAGLFVELCTGLQKLHLVYLNSTAFQHYAKHYDSSKLSDPVVLLHLPALKEFILNEKADCLFTQHEMYRSAAEVLLSYELGASCNLTQFCEYACLSLRNVHHTNIPSLLNCKRISVAPYPSLWQIPSNRHYEHLTDFAISGGCCLPRYNISDLLQLMPNLKHFSVFNTTDIYVDLHLLSKTHPNIERLALSCQPNCHPYEIADGLAKFHYLTHLTVPLCTLSAAPVMKTDAKPWQYDRGFKRLRVGAAPDAELMQLATFNLVLHNCHLLTVLEIGIPDGEDNILKEVSWQCLHNVGKLKHLTDLSLVHVPVTSGNFFMSIATGCLQVQFLNIHSLGPSGRCCYDIHLRQALPYFSNLVHLRIEQPNFGFNGGLFTALEALRNLQRVFISSLVNTEPPDYTSLMKFLSHKKNLLFAVFVNGAIPDTRCIEIKKTLKNSFRQRAAFFVQVNNCLRKSLNIPVYHFDIVGYKSWARRYENL